MSLEDFIPDIDSSEQWWESSETSKEVSEKFKEAVKKTWAKIKKTQKDEKKAKKFDFLLAWILVKIIVDKKYDFILDTLFKSLYTWFPSNFILWILSIININISHKVREFSKKENITFEFKEIEIIEFDDNNLNVQIKNRINEWIEDMTDSVSIEYSSIQTENLIELLKSKKSILLNYTSKVFTFFLKDINIRISEEKSRNISEFILWEVEKSIKNLKIEEI